MKISICIPQYNRINYLLRSLSIIESQSYSNIEIVISDDCSTDDTEARILELVTQYRFPIIFSKNKKNEGYDRNFRKCIELATGEYSLVIGNDDTLYGDESISFLVEFLKRNNYPDVGFCNLIEERTDNTLVERANITSVLGSGASVAIKYYSCFSFVGGLIYRRSNFLKFNTDKYDGSVYTQMYLGVLMIASGSTLFSIKEPLVLKDLLLDGKFRNSYRDRIAKKWKDFKIVDGGLPSVMNVLINAMNDAKTLTQKNTFYIFKRMYLITYPHWILDYKDNKALPEAFGLVLGLLPKKNFNYGKLTLINKIKINSIYFVSTIGALLIPVFLFKKYKSRLYTYFKK